MILTETMSTDPSDWEVLQRQYYYPFGMPMQGVWQNTTDPRMDYLYNGKELEEELSLHWLAYGFRHYDPVVGRFTGVDPIADQFAHLSPFNYANNSPIKSIDLHGLQELDASSGLLLRLRPIVPRSAIRPGSERGPSNLKNPSALGPIQVETNSSRLSNFSGTNLSISDPNVTGGDIKSPFGAKTMELIQRDLEIRYASYDYYDDFGKEEPLPIRMTDDGYTTSFDQFEYITLFRGVHADHPDINNARMGIAVPWGGHSDPDQHSLGNNRSEFTSWTRIPMEANQWATSNGAGGIILMKQFHISELIQSRTAKHDEGEYLVRGTVIGALPVPTF